MITSIDILGSISSRKMGYYYGYLGPLSFVAYGLVGYLTYQIASLNWAFLLACTIGIYDGTVGWKLSILLDANFGKDKEKNLNMSTATRIIRMRIISGLFSGFGFFIAKGLS